MRATAVVVIGAGQAGLAMSRCLTEAAVDHVVLERAQVAQAWRTQRWDSLRLLTPTWMTRLPGLRYGGADPDGYLRAGEVVDLLDDYRRSFDAPVHTATTVVDVRPVPAGFRVDTDSGSWRCRAVVVATGTEGMPTVPAIAHALPRRIAQVAALHYRRPHDLAPGGVLVVGASASGVQLADELHRSGRPVTLAAGEHVRLPRTYRGRDIHGWMDAIGLLDERHDQVDDLARARRLPSAQLVGGTPRRTLDLGTLARTGVAVVGRLAGVAGGRAQFSGSLPGLVTAADLKMDRLLARIDAHVAGRPESATGPPDLPGPTRLPPPPTELDLRRFDTVVWATGHRPTYPWLEPSLLDRHGRIRHDGGVTELPGLYLLGLPFLRRRSSTFLHGVGPDAREHAAHLGARLGSYRAAA